MRYPVFRSKLVGSASSGAEMEPHPLQFSTNPGPSGPAGIRTLTQILRAGNFLPSPRGNPRNRGPGADSPCQGEMSRSDRGGRVGEYGHEVSILSRPPAILKVNCPEGAREGGLGHWFLSHRWERTPPPAGGEIASCERRNDRMKPRSETKFRTKFFCLLFFQEKQVNSSSSAWAQESARPGPRRPWRRRGGPAAPGRSPAGRRTPPYLPPACRGRG